MRTSPASPLVPKNRKSRLYAQVQPLCMSPRAALTLGSQPPNIPGAFPPLSAFPFSPGQFHCTLVPSVTNIIGCVLSARPCAGRQGKGGMWKDGMISVLQALMLFFLFNKGQSVSRFSLRQSPIALLPASHLLGTWHHFLVLTFFRVSVSSQLDA